MRALAELKEQTERTRILALAQAPQHHILFQLPALWNRSKLTSDLSETQPNSQPKTIERAPTAVNTSSSFAFTDFTDECSAALSRRQIYDNAEREYQQRQLIRGR